MKAYVGGEIPPCNTHPCEYYNIVHFTNGLGI